MSEKLSKTDWCFYQIVLFVARKSQGSLKIKNVIKYYSTALIIFEIISLKWIKLLTNFCWLETICAQLHLRRPGFTYRAWEPFSKHCEIIQKFREIDHLKHVYKNKLDKACFALNVPYSDSKDLAKRTVSHRKDRAHENAIILNMVDIKED